MNNNQTNFAVISHILPPSPSGQAMVLYRLLQRISPNKYCLISRVNYQSIKNISNDSSKLPAEYYHLDSGFQLTRPNRFKLYYLRIFINALIGIINRAKKITLIMKNENCRILIACSGDLYDIPSAWLASKWLKISLVVYLFDDYAYQWIGAERIVAKWLEPKVLNHAHSVIVTNEFMEQEYLDRYGLKTRIIRNLCYIPYLKEIDESDSIFNRKTVNIVYTGAIYHANHDAFRNLIAAIKKLNKSKIILHLYTAQSESSLRSEGIISNMIVIHKHINQFEIPEVLRQADVLFLPLAFESKIEEVIKTSAPGKMGDYLSSGRPILVHAPGDSFVSWYFKNNNCGLVVDKNDTQLLFRALKRIISDKKLQKSIGINARVRAEKDFNQDSIQSEFIRLLESIS